MEGILTDAVNIGLGDQARFIAIDVLVDDLP
jgi:hypothetical protein